MCTHISLSYLHSIFSVKEKKRIISAKKTCYRMPRFADYMSLTPRHGVISKSRKGYHFCLFSHDKISENYATEENRIQKPVARIQPKVENLLLLLIFFVHILVKSRKNI